MKRTRTGMYGLIFCPIRAFDVSNQAGSTAERSEAEHGSEATMARRARRSRVILHGPPINPLNTDSYKTISTSFLCPSGGAGTLPVHSELSS